MPGIDQYTKLLLHCNGADASTTFIDSATGKAITAVETAQVDTAQSKFGGASLLLDGNSDILTTPDHADFTTGSSDFTVDCWIKRAAAGVTHGICMFNVTSIGLGFYVFSNNLLCAIIRKDPTNYSANSTGTIGTDWTHVAFVRDGNTLRLFINGTADGTKDVTGITADDPTGVAMIGKYSTFFFNGWIDEFRVSKGIARWTANFTPPTSAYSRPSGFLPFFM